MIEPSALISLVLNGVSSKKAGAGMEATLRRASDFPSLLHAQLAGIALVSAGRTAADKVLDAYWADEDRQQELLSETPDTSEVIIGSGFHAAAYAAIRVLSGHQKPLVLERSDRVGGTFATTAQPTFYLNSRNRPGGAGLAGDQGASLNRLPGALVQAADVSMAEYQTNADMAFVIRLALAQFAEVITNATVVDVSGGNGYVNVDICGRGSYQYGRLIDARGVGDPVAQDSANGTSVVTFAQFMQRMAGVWPLRGLRRVAVLGGGDSGKCAVESLLGIAPAPMMAAAALDHVERIDWYSQSIPDTCDDWRDQQRGRYQAIGHYLRPDRFGMQRLNVLDREAVPVALPDSALIEGRTYDLVVLCTGNRESRINGLDASDFSPYRTPDDIPVATSHFSMPAYRVGPHAQLPFTDREYADGIADVPANKVSMFRTAAKTAALAATLPQTTED